MPELPEVETVRRALSRLVLGKRIVTCIVMRRDYVRTGFDLIKSIDEQTIQSIERKGKILAVRFSNGLIVLHHLGMSGRLLYTVASDPLEPHTHIRIALEDGRFELRQRDPRRFGYVALLRENELDSFTPWTSLGTDPFKLKPDAFHAMLTETKRLIKSFLLDQRHVAGLGNIYTDEALFRAGIHPKRLCPDIDKTESTLLLKLIRTVLNESIAAGGSSTNDFQTLDGTLGEFQHKHRVYRREGQPCKKCGEIIMKIELNGRGTHFCPNCQREEYRC